MAVSGDVVACAAVTPETDNVIGNREIVEAVGVEVDRTLPFWRCFTDLRAAVGALRNTRPAVISRETRLLWRLPCQVFAGVDVVWARTEVTLRVPLKNGSGKRYRSNDPDVALPQFWKEVPFREVVFTLGTVHFVHRDAHREDSAGREKSFHIQSVFFHDDPSILQCVAGTMVSFAFMVYSSLRVAAARATLGRGYHPLRREAADDETAVSAAALSEAYLPPAGTRVLILGMGGNSMAVCLREVLGPDAEIHVVEVEPAVVQVCGLAGTLVTKAKEDDQHLHVHLAEATEFLQRASGVADDSFDFVFMDLFEPMNARMEKGESLVHLCERKLRPGGLLVVNDHQLPSAKALQPFCDLVGAANVQGVNLHGWNESVVVCVKPGDPRTDCLSALCHRGIAEVVFDIFEEVRPGWLPDLSWLKSCARVPPKTGCRVWTS